jgi:hypothetical protein
MRLAAVVRELKSLYSRSTENSQEALVFSKSQGLPLAADNLRKKALRTACKRAGLQRIDWHTLRHTHGTLLHSQGTPLKVAQAQLGHSHMATTLGHLYTRQWECTKRQQFEPFPQKDDRAVQFLARSRTVLREPTPRQLLQGAREKDGTQPPPIFPSIHPNAAAGAPRDRRQLERACRCLPERQNAPLLVLLHENAREELPRLALRRARQSPSGRCLFFE